MTDGTSQGLFIVVAIVIFGIFVVLAYILFEDTLSPALANMFGEAMEQSSDSLNGVKSRQDVDMVTTSVEHAASHSKSGNAITITNDGVSLAGVVVPLRDITVEGTSYVLSFNMKLDSGTVTHIGGHLGGNHVSGEGISNLKIMVDGNHIIPEVPQASKNDWYTGVKIPGGMAVGDEVQVDVSFTLDFFSASDYANAPIKIQPNRNWPAGSYWQGKLYTATFSNITLLEK